MLIISIIDSSVSALSAGGTEGHRGLRLGATAESRSSESISASREEEGEGMDGEAEGSGMSKRCMERMRGSLADSSKLGRSPSSPSSNGGGEEPLDAEEDRVTGGVSSKPPSWSKLPGRVIRGRRRSEGGVGSWVGSS